MSLFADLPADIIRLIISPLYTSDIDRTVLRCVSSRMRSMINGPIVEKSKLCDTLINGGHYTLIEWARQTGCILDGVGIMLRIVAGKTITAEMLDLLTYLHSAGFSLHSLPLCVLTVADITVFDNNINVLCGCDDPGSSISHIEKIAVYAANDGRLDILKWLRAHRYDIGFTIQHAAAAGHLDVIQWLYSEGFSWNIETAIRAARGGHLDVLKWMRANGWVWDHHHDVCRAAAYGDHLEVLEWLRGNGCPWNKQYCLRACGYASRVNMWINAQP